MIYHDVNIVKDYVCPSPVSAWVFLEIGVTPVLIHFRMFHLPFLFRIPHIYGNPSTADGVNREADMGVD